MITNLFDVGYNQSNEKSFHCTTDFNSIAGTSETAYMLLKNPSGNQDKMLLTHVHYGINGVSTRSILNMYRDPTITSDGTALTPENTYIKASPLSSTMQAFKNPTISAFGTKIMHPVVVPSNSMSRGIARTYLLAPGKNILFTLQNDVMLTPSMIGLYWLEVFI